MTQVMIYSHAFAPKIGGVETLVMSLAAGLTSQTPAPATAGAQVTVVTRTPQGEYLDASLPFPVVRQPALRQLLRVLRAADVIHVAGPALVPMLLGLLMRKQVVVEHSAYQAICPNGLLLDERTKIACPGHFVARRYGECWRCNAANVSRWKSLSMLLLTFPRRWMCGKVARNIVPTAHVGKRLMLSRTVTIYHGVPLVPSSREGPACASPVTFAYVGRLVSEKGLNLLLESSRCLEVAGYSFRLKMIGDGPERAPLEQSVDALGLRSRVSFTGYLQGEDLQNALRDVSVVVMPSIWEETAGLSAIEHMMRGSLVIAADIGGLGELVDGVGLKFPVGNLDGLASCMKQVIDDPNLARVLGQKAGDRARAIFGTDRMLTEHLRVYNELATEARTPLQTKDER